MPFDWTAVGMQAANAFTGGIIGQGIGMLNDQRQLQQQRALMADQEAANKRMYDYGQAGQLRMWEKTGPQGMMKQYKAAGLNPALMYGGSGGGGTTGGGQPAPVTGGTAPSGGGEITAAMGMGIQMQLLQAQKQNIEADTKLKETEAEKKAGVDTQEAETRIESLAQGIENAKAAEQLTKIQTRIQEIDAQIKGDTIQEVTDQVIWNSQRVLEELDQVARETYIKKATMNTVIDKAKAELIGAFLRNAMMKAQTEATYTGIVKTEAEIRNIVRQGVQKWKDLSIGQQNANTGQNRQEQDAWINDVQKSTGLPAEILKEGVDGVMRGGKH